MKKKNKSVKSNVKVTCKSIESKAPRIHKDLIRLIKKEKQDIESKLNNKSKINTFNVSFVYASKMLARRINK